MKRYLLNSRLVGGSIADMGAAVKLIKETGGRLLHLAPLIGGWVVECSEETGEGLGLVEWV